MPSDLRGRERDGITDASTAAEKPPSFWLRRANMVLAALACCRLSDRATTKRLPLMRTIERFSRLHSSCLPMFRGAAAAEVRASEATPS